MFLHEQLEFTSLALSSHNAQPAGLPCSHPDESRPEEYQCCWADVLLDWWPWRTKAALGTAHAGWHLHGNISGQFRFCFFYLIISIYFSLSTQIRNTHTPILRFFWSETSPWWDFWTILMGIFNLYIKYKRHGREACCCVYLIWITGECCISVPKVRDDIKRTLQICWTLGSIQAASLPTVNSLNALLASDTHTSMHCY